MQANVWVAIFGYVGNYFWTHYFFVVLGAIYTFPSYKINHVSIIKHPRLNQEWLSSDFFKLMVSCTWACRFFYVFQKPTFPMQTACFVEPNVIANLESNN